MKFLRIMLRIRVDFDSVFRRCMSQESMLSSSSVQPESVISTLTLVACRSL